MSRPTPEYIAEATALLEAKVQGLRRLTYAQACELPEAQGADALIADTKASITTHRHTDAYQLAGKTLIVVLAAKPSLFGMTAFHIERGLVFHLQSQFETPLSLSYRTPEARCLTQDRSYAANRDDA